MGLADDLASIPGRQFRRCDLRIWLDSLPDDDAAAVKAAILDPERAMSRIAAAISRNGHTTSAGTIANHRRAICQTCADWTTP